MEPILLVIIGGLITLFIAIWFEYLKKPRLYLSISDYIDIDYTNKNKPANRARFLRINLKNKIPLKIFFWVLRNPASQCHGHITFLDLNNQEIFPGKKMFFRWPNTPEPEVKYIHYKGIDNHPIIDYNSIFPYLKRDIQSGGFEEIDVAAKFNDEDECYGWSNESYNLQHIWRPPQWKLQRGKYLIKVTVYSSTVKIEKTFKLINDSDLNGFRLEPF
jgi:hypothetical protein